MASLSELSALAHSARQKCEESTQSLVEVTAWLATAKGKVAEALGDLTLIMGDSNSDTIRSYIALLTDARDSMAEMGTRVDEIRDELARGRELGSEYIGRLLS